MQCIIEKQDRRVFTLCTLLAAFLCMRVASAARVELDIPREVQLTDQTCWAAVSIMALRSFEADGAEQLTQRELILYREAHINTPADLKKPANKRRLKRLETEDCKDSLTLCSKPGLTFLYTLRSEDVPLGKALAAEHFKKEIVDRKRPVIVQRDYRGVSDANGDLPSGEHYVIVIGYDDAGPEPRLLVYNPWPTQERADQMIAAHRAVKPREEWIPYSQYLDPPVSAGYRAAHEGDEYKLRKFPLLAMLLGPYPPLVEFEPPTRRIDARLSRDEGGGGR
jgi:hypothetical protein